MPSGGARENAGRKPKEITVIRRILHEQLGASAEHALWFMAQVVDDEEAPINVRVDCAQYIADRVFGKPTVHISETLTEQTKEALLHWESGSESVTSPVKSSKPPTSHPLESS